MSSSTLPYIIKPYTEKKPYSEQEQTYPLLVPREGKCWNCKERKTPLQRCGICRNVRYCSQACQRKDWPRHRHICRAPSFYEISMCAIILVSSDSLSREEQLRATRTAYKLIDQNHIHPNYVLCDTERGGGQYISACDGFFQLNSSDLMPFLERGLSPQEVIRNEYSFIDFNETHAQILLEYGGADLHFPRHHALPVLKYLVSKGCDPDAIVAAIFLHEENTILFLASIGCTFTQVDDYGVSLLPFITNSSYMRKVRKIMRLRGKIIKAGLSEQLIPVLVDIVIEYTGILLKESSPHHKEI